MSRKSSDHKHSDKKAPGSRLQQLEQLDKPWFYRLALIGGTLLFALAAVLWWQVAAVSPERVFWGTISNNLKVTNVARHTVSEEENSTLDQWQQINLGDQKFVKTDATIEQTQSDGITIKVVTETIATPQADFSRYTAIETSQPAPDGQPFNFAPVLGQWSKQDVAEGTGGAFTEALFSVVPLANISAKDRRQIVSDMQKNSVYAVDYKQVVKRQQDGRLVYDYTVTVNAQQYVKAIKQIDAAMGLQSLQDLDEGQYGEGSLEIKISVDARSRQLLGVVYPGDTRRETYSNYGVSEQLAVPEQTVPQAELQTKLNGILGTQ